MADEIREEAQIQSRDQLLDNENQTQPHTNEDEAQTQGQGENGSNAEDGGTSLCGTKDAKPNKMASRNATMSYKTPRVESKGKSENIQILDKNSQKNQPNRRYQSNLRQYSGDPDNKAPA